MFRLRWLTFLPLLSAVVAGAQDDSERLYATIRAGDLRGLETLLDQGVSPNTADSRGVTPLMNSAAIGSLESMKLLLRRGAELNAQNAFGSTALIWSASDAQKVRLLLDQGANVNLAAKSGKTALLVALSMPSAEAGRLLLARGADTSAVDKNGVTALLAALEGNDAATIRMLVEAGADVNRSATQGFIPMTPLMAASAHGDLAAVRLLLAKGAKVNEVSPKQSLEINHRPVVVGEFTPLLLAATYGPPELVKTLLAAGADVNVAEARGMTPLMMTLSTDRLNPETVKMLLDHGADLRAKSLVEEDALDWAQKYGDIATIEVLGGKQRAGGPLAPAPTATPDLRAAVERSVQLLEKTSAQFFVQSACYACHAQSAATFAAGAAHAKGIPIDEHAASERLRQMTFTFASNGPSIMEGRRPGDSGLYVLDALARSGYAADRTTDYLAAGIAAEQSQDGAWHVTGGIARTPLEDGDFSRTAMAIRALNAYTAPARTAEMKARVERAKRWLLHAAAVVTEDWDMRLTGVAAAGAGEAELRKLAEPILALQRLDGGWSQRTGLVSDAYATGMTLSALAEAGILQPESGSKSNSAYANGVKFLLVTQANDGSWHVASRAATLQPYFESGFPYGHDQWISSMGTAWAANALALALGAPKPSK